MLNVEKYSEYIAKAIINCKKSDYIVCSCCAQKEMCEQLKNVEQIKKWLFEKWKPHLTKDEEAILRNLPKKFKYIARDKDEELYLYKAKPVRSESIWNCLDKNYIKLSVFNHMFKFIKWNDEEPYNIEELLKED